MNPEMDNLALYCDIAKTIKINKKKMLFIS